MEELCKNCGNILQGPYCHHCGQKLTDGRIRFRDLWEHFEAWFFSSDSRLYRTVGRLTINPGQVASDFIAGKRVIYYKPISYFLILTALYMAIRSIIGFDPIENWNMIFGTAPKAPNPQQAVTMEASIWLREHLDKMLIFLVLIFAGVAKLFYWRSPYFYAEYISFSLYAVGHFLLFSMLAMVLAIYVDRRLFLLNYAFQLIYFPFALTTFHQGNRVWLFTKGFFAALISYVSYVMLTLSAVIFIMILLGNSSA